MVAVSQGCPGLGLRALLCCVFDKDEGPIVQCSDPPDAVGKQFKPLGRYLLPETFVKGRVVSVVLDDNVVLGAPVYIEDTLYDRNCFQFNICMVIHSGVDAEPHRDLAQHLAVAFHTLEVEVKLVSSPDEVGHVQSILASLRAQLNLSGDCFVRVTDSHCITFRVRRRCPVLQPGPALSKVPVPLVDIQGLLLPTGQPATGPTASATAARAEPDARANLSPLSTLKHPVLPFEPDPTLLLLVPFIDGIRSVQEVIDSSALDEDRVLVCLRHLLHFGLIAVIDAIEPESRYCLTPEFHVAFEQPEVLGEVVRYVTAGRLPSSAELVEVVQGLYAEIDGWEQPLWEFQQAHAEELQGHLISLRHFVTFGLLRGFLERIGSYAQALSQGEMRELQTLRSSTIPRRKQELKNMGMSSTQVNKEPQIKAMVARLNELKAKEKRRPSVATSLGSECEATLAGPRTPVG